MGKVKRMVLIAIPIISVFLIGEIILRASYGDGFLSLIDPQLHHRRRPYIDIERTWGSGEDFRLITNSLGWRDKEPNHRIKKITDKHKRIIFLGDSITEGIGFDQEETFSGVTEKILRANGYDCEVLNGGMASYSPLLEYMRLKRFLDKGYKADAVVLLPDLSDIQDEALYNAQYMYDRDNQPIGLRAAYYRCPLIYGLLNSSCLARSSARFVKSFHDTKMKRWLNASRKRITSDDLLDLNLGEQSKLRANWLFHKPSLSGWAKDGIRYLKENIQRIRRICDENEILLITAIYPWPEQLYIKEDPAYYKVLREYFSNLYALRKSFYGIKPFETPSIYEKTVRIFLRRSSIDLINFFDDFAKIKDAYKFYIPNDIHFNKMGHSFIGRKIAERLMEYM